MRVFQYHPPHSNDCAPHTMETNIELCARYGRSGGHALDLGAGRGATSRALAERGFVVTAFDLKPLEQADFPNIQTRQANLEEGIPLGDQTADIALAQEILHQLENPWAFFREVARVLRSGGVFVMSCPNLDHLFVRLFQIAKRQTPFFLEEQYRHAHQVTPTPRWNVERMGEAAGLTLLEVTYNMNYLPGLRLQVPLKSPRLGHTLITVWQR